MGSCTAKKTPPLASRDKLSSRVHGGFDPRAPLTIIKEEDPRAPLTIIKEEEPSDLALEKRLDEMIAEIEKDEMLFSMWHREVARRIDRGLFHTDSGK